MGWALPAKRPLRHLKRESVCGDRERAEGILDGCAREICDELAPFPEDEETPVQFLAIVLIFFDASGDFGNGEHLGAEGEGVVWMDVFAVGMAISVGSVVRADVASGEEFVIENGELWHSGRPHAGSLWEVKQNRERR